MSAKEGYEVKITLTVDNADGQTISKTTNSWYGFNPQGADAMALDVLQALLNMGDEYNKNLFGEDWRVAGDK